jgi:hypothetical protein
MIFPIAIKGVFKKSHKTETIPDQFLLFGFLDMINFMFFVFILAPILCAGTKFLGVTSWERILMARQHDEKSLRFPGRRYLRRDFHHRFLVEW